MFQQLKEIIEQFNCSQGKEPVIFEIDGKEYSINLPNFLSFDEW